MVTKETTATEKMNDHTKKRWYNTITLSALPIMVWFTINCYVKNEEDIQTKMLKEKELLKEIIYKPLFPKI